MRNMSNLNDLYNVQDEFLLCEIIEIMFNVSGGYNPRKINSASKLSGCIQREKSKVILALPTNNAIMETFEETLMCGFSSVNTRLSFNTELLMPNFTYSEYDKIKIHESFQAYKRDDLKAIYKIKCDYESQYVERQVIVKILKLHEYCTAVLKLQLYNP